MPTLGHEEEKAQTIAACAKVRSQAFFSATVNRSMENLIPDLSGAESLGTYIFDKVLMCLASNGVPETKIRNFPTSMSNLISTIAPAFDASYVKYIESCAERFECLVYGEDLERKQSHKNTFTQLSPLKLCDVFIQELPVSAWIQQICKTIARHTFDLLGQNDMSKWHSRNWSKTIRKAAAKACFKSLHQQVIPKARPKRLAKMGSAADLSSTETVHATGVEGNDGPFTQVTLVGHNLIEAWNSSPLLKSLETESQVASDWTPRSQPGAPFSYHGSKAPQSLPDRDLATKPSNAVVGHVFRNQLTPANRSLPAVWTAFSPLRAFLWAVFTSGVFSCCPGSNSDAAEEPWVCGSHISRGVALLQFKTPGAEQCTNYTIPPGEEYRWSSHAEKGHEVLLPNSSPATQWAYFRAIHGQEAGTDWPNVVHGREILTLRKNQPFSNCWRSVWSGAGIDVLNAGHEKSFAINFSIADSEDKSQQHR